MQASNPFMNRSGISLLVISCLSCTGHGRRIHTAEEKPTRWGIMGSGMIASDFVGALKASEAKAEVVAVGARSLQSAQKFSKEHAVARAYEGYEALAADPEIDVIYVATIANTHVQCAEIAIKAGKHVLVEKPIALTASEAAALAQKARDAGVFLMEGMWTRAFPAVVKVRELLDSGAIGKAFGVQCDFGWPADPDVHTRLFDAASGGVALDVAMYPVNFVLLASGGVAPGSILATGSLIKGVDWTMAIALSGFKGCDRLVATILCSLDGSTPEEVVISGTKGTIRIHGSAHVPTRVTLSQVGEGRGVSEDETFEFPLPPVPEGALPFYYPGSQGFVYEARLVHDALAAGRLEPAEWTHEDMVNTLRVVETVRAQVQGGASQSS